MIIMRTFLPKAPSRRARSVLWGGSIGGESDEEMNDGGGNDGKEHKPAEDLSIDLGVTLGDVSGSNGGQKASFGETYSLTESEDEMKVESFLPSVMRNGRDPTTPNDAVGNEGIRVPRFFPTSSDEEEEGSAVKQIIELPLDGILLQLIPALLIVVLGLFLTVVIQVEAGRFDAMVGEDGGTAVVVTDLRDLENVSP